MRIQSIEFLRKKCSAIIERGFQKRLLSVDAAGDKAFLNSFPEPADSLERSYFQYLCQRRQTPVFIRVVQNGLAAVLWPFYYFRPCGSARPFSPAKGRAVYLSDGIGQEIIPLSLRTRYPDILTSGYREGAVWAETEKNFMRELVSRYGGSPFFCLKALLKIRLYAHCIRAANAEALIVYGEFSFTSSLLTGYCRSVNVRHINVQHGEKFFTIRDAYAEYDEFVVWDAYYRKLFDELKAPAETLRVELPEGFLQLEAAAKKEAGEIDFTYYLGGESEKDLMRIADALGQLAAAGWRVSVRPHPRWSDDRTIAALFGRFEIEDVRAVTVEESILRTKNAVSGYSTVLFQAWFAGRTAILDDVSNARRFEQIRERGYILFEKPHKLLSQILL